MHFSLFKPQGRDFMEGKKNENYKDVGEQGLFPYEFLQFKRPQKAVSWDRLKVLNFYMPFPFLIKIFLFRLTWLVQRTNERITEQCIGVKIRLKSIQTPTA